MDSEELNEIAELQHKNAPITRKNAYHVDAIWGGYKGSVTGLMAGLMIGAAAGVMIGGVAAGGLALALGGISTEVLSAVVAAGAVFGMLHGADKFERVGIAAGSSSAVGQKLEGRMKEYMRSMFVELKHEIRELKGQGRGGRTESLSQIANEKTLVDAVQEKQDDFRVQHCDENHCKDNEKKLIFWRIAAIGAAVGAAAGALMGYGADSHMVESALKHVGGEKLLEAAASHVTAMAVTGAAIGASFGINRDIFRKIYDVAENLFMGNIGFGLGKAKEKEQEVAVSAAPTQEKLSIRVDPAQAVHQPVFVSMASASSERTETFFQDRLMREMLLSMDHTTAIRQ